MVPLSLSRVGWRWTSVLEHRFWAIELSNMRHAYSLRPEWAYTASSFPRTIGVVLVTLAVGTTAGATVVFSLVDGSAGQTSMTVRSWVPQIQAASALSGETPKAQRVAGQSGSANDSETSGHVESGVAGTPGIGYATPAPARTAALAEAGPATDDVATKVGVAPSPVPEKAPVVVPADKKVMKKHHVAARYAWRAGPLGLVPGEYHMNGTWSRY